MTRTGKIARPLVRNLAYRSGFDRLDAALAENTRSRSDDIEKIDRLRVAVFGDAAIDVIRQERSRNAGNSE